VFVDESLHTAKESATSDSPLQRVLWKSIAGNTQAPPKISWVIKSKLMRVILHRETLLQVTVLKAALYQSSISRDANQFRIIYCTVA